MSRWNYHKLGIEVDDVEGGRRERKGGGHPMTWPSGTTTWRDANGEVDILMPDELDQAAMMVAFANQLRQQAWSGERLSAVAVDLILAQAQSLDEMTALADRAIEMIANPEEK